MVNRKTEKWTCQLRKGSLGENGIYDTRELLSAGNNLGHLEDQNFKKLQIVIDKCKRRAK